MPRDVILIRVSKDDQAGSEHYSLPVQEEKCRAYSAASSGTVLELFTEVQTSWTDDIEHRPVFQEALAYAVREHADRFVVYRLDRFARDKYIFFYADRLLKRAGIALRSATEFFEDTADGELIKGIHAVFAHAESARLSRRVRDALGAKQRAGGWAGWAPYGYRRQGGDLVVDEPTASGYRLAVRLALEGAPSFREVARVLRAAGYRGAHGGPLPTRVVAYMLRSPAYLGMVVAEHDAAGGPLLLPGTHPPLIERPEWERLQQAVTRMAGRAASGQRRAKTPYALSGTLLCARCGARLVGQVYGSGYYESNRYPVYACAGRLDRLDCDLPGLRTAACEELVAGLLDKLTLPENWQAAVLERLRLPRQPRITLEQIAAQEQRLTQLYQEGFIATYEEFKRRWEELQAQRAELQPPLTPVVLEAGALLARGVGQLWRAAPDVAAKRKLARALFESIVLDGADSRTVEVVRVDWRPEIRPLLEL